MLFIIILKIIGWVVAIPIGLLYAFIESLTDLGININKFKLKNLIRIVFIPIISFLILILLGIKAGLIFLIIYFGFIFVSRSFYMRAFHSNKLKNILLKYVKNKFGKEKTIKNIMKALRKKRKANLITVFVDTKDVSIKIFIPGFLVGLVLKLFPRGLIRKGFHEDSAIWTYYHHSKKVE